MFSLFFFLLKSFDDMTKYANESLWIKMKSPFGTEEYIPKLIDINPEQFQFYYDKAKFVISLLN